LVAVHEKFTCAFPLSLAVASAPIGTTGAMLSFNVAVLMVDRGPIAQVL
jgi:hypothetical protein